MKRLNEILVIDILVVVLAVLVFVMRPSVINVILGIPAAVFFPGYVFLAAFLPDKSRLEWVERLTYSFGISTALVIVIGLILNSTMWGVTVISTTATLSILTLILSGVALVRRRDDVEVEHRMADLLKGYSWWRRKSKADKGMMLAICLSVMVMLFSTVFVYTRSRQDSSYTEFYILNSEYMAEDYIKMVTLDKQYELIYGIYNQEYKENSYLVEVRLDGVLKYKTDEMLLKPGNKLENIVKYIPDTVGENQKLEFLLFKSGSNSPLNILYLRINTTYY